MSTKKNRSLGLLDFLLCAFWAPDRVTHVLGPGFQKISGCFFCFRDIAFWSRWGNAEQWWSTHPSSSCWSHIHPCHTHRHIFGVIIIMYLCIAIIIIITHHHDHDDDEIEHLSPDLLSPQGVPSQRSWPTVSHGWGVNTCHDDDDDDDGGGLCNDNNDDDDEHLSSWWWRPRLLGWWGNYRPDDSNDGKMRGMVTVEISLASQISSS